MRTALITGASRGIGQAIAKQLASSGVKVLSPGRDEMDLSNLDSVRVFIRKNDALAVDILVNNAGENVVQPLVDIDFETWHRIQTTNIDAAFLLVQHFGKGMCARKWGRILNVASLFSFLTKAGRASYTVSKSGLAGLTRTAAVEWAERGVLVNALSPGFVNTELTRKNNSPDKISQIAAQIPVGRLCEPDEIARVASFLVSDQNTYLTGQNIVVDGGISIT